LKNKNNPYANGRPDIFNTVVDL